MGREKIHLLSGDLRHPGKLGAGTYERSQPPGPEGQTIDPRGED